MNSRYTEQPKAPKINVKIRLKNVHPGTQTLHEVEGDTIGDVTMSKSKASAEPVFNLPSGI